jgi:hypothetical protein
LCGIISLKIGVFLCHEKFKQWQATQKGLILLQD